MSPSTALGHRPAAPTATTLFLFGLSAALLCFAFWPREEPQAIEGRAAVERARSETALGESAAAAPAGERP